MSDRTELDRLRREVEELQVEVLHLQGELRRTLEEKLALASKATEALTDLRREFRETLTGLQEEARRLIGIARLQGHEEMAERIHARIQEAKDQLPPEDPADRAIRESRELYEGGGDDAGH